MRVYIGLDLSAQQTAFVIMITSYQCFLVDRVIIDLFHGHSDESPKSLPRTIFADVVFDPLPIHGCIYGLKK